MPRFSSRSLLCALQLALAACASEDDAQAHLIQLDAVEQRWERSEQLFVHGAGLPPGMRGEAHLVGLIFPPGEQARAVDMKLPCRALGKSEAVVALDAPDVSSGSAEGPFEGRLELRFGSRDEARLAGRLDHVLIRLGSTPTLEQQFERRQNAQRFQRRLGIAALVLAEHGLAIAELNAQGPAAKAELKVGDVLLRLDGRPVQLPHDLVPSASADNVTLETRRGEEHGSTQIVRIPIDPAAPPLLWSLLGLMFALGASLGGLLGATLPDKVVGLPRRKELWLAACSALSLLLALGLVVDVLDPVLRDACRAFGLGLLGAAVFVCCLRRLRPTSCTERDPALAPLL